MSFTLDATKRWTNSIIDSKDKAAEFLNDLSKGHVGVLCPKENNLESFGETYQEKFLFFERIKMRILECFKINELKLRDFNAYDRFDALEAEKSGPRKIPGSIQREGSFVDPKAILMPSFVNIGAYVSEGTMVDTWATVGSCAYVGKFVHISGGVGIGGVLEPAQAKPVVIEDHAFLGSRSIIVEGAFVGQGAVIGSGVNLTASTKIYDLQGNSPKELAPGYIPPYSVVVSGSKEYKHGFHINCALIVKKRDQKTDLKVSLNDALRTIS